MMTFTVATPSKYDEDISPVALSASARQQSGGTLPSKAACSVRSQSSCQSGLPAAGSILHLASASPTLHTAAQTLAAPAGVLFLSNENSIPVLPYMCR